MPHQPDLERAASFRAAVRQFLKHTEVAAARHGLTTRRYDLLLFIQGTPGGRATTSQLLPQLQLNQPSASELIQRAVDAGLVARSVDERDRRRIWLELTPKGKEVVVAVFHDLLAARDELAASIHEAELRLRA